MRRSNEICIDISRITWYYYCLIVLCDVIREDHVATLVSEGRGNTKRGRNDANSSGRFGYYTDSKNTGKRQDKTL